MGYWISANGVYHEVDPLPGDTAVPQRPDADHDWDGAQWVMLPPKRISFLFSEFERIKQEKFEAGYPCTLDALATCIQCRVGSDDKANLTDIFVRARQYVDASDPTHLCKVRCAMNMDHYLAASDMVTFLAGMFDWGQGIMDKYHAHKDEVLALQTTMNDPNSTQVQIDAAVAALDAYDVTTGW